MKRIFLGPLGCALAAAALAAGCGKPAQAPVASPAQVTVSRPAEEQVADCLELTGTVAPSRTVDLVARVSGYLQSADFEEGAFVEAGKLLFVIEPQPYEQQLALAQAALVMAQAEYDRQQALMKDNATSAANVERWLSNRDQAAAQVELAKLNLGYTRVSAPFAGRIGRSLVDVGNLVGPTVNTRLATLDQLSPVYVNFSLNERDALRIAEEIRRRGGGTALREGKVPVQIGLQNQEGYPQEGLLDFVDTGIRSDTGTLQLRAVFENADRSLMPGAFARVRIPLGEPRPMPVVPARAIGNDQEGDYVLVVDSANVASRRTVARGPATKAGVAIRSGLTAADRVIVNGMMQAKPGAAVRPVEAAADPGAAAKPD